MATLHVRNVPDPLYALLRERAAANGRSIGAEAVHLLESQLVVQASQQGRRVFGRRRRSVGTGLFTRFTERGRRTVVLAQEAARELGHGSVGTAHLLLGLLRVPDGVAAGLLGELGLDEPTVAAELEARLGRGEPPPTGQIPFESGAKKALELALREALALGHDYIGTEHILLGVAREGASLGAEIVHAVEPDVDKLRDRVVRALALTLRTAQPPLLPQPPGPSFRVLDLKGDAADWERQLNAAAADGYDLVEILERRAVLRRD